MRFHSTDLLQWPQSFLCARQLFAQGQSAVLYGPPGPGGLCGCFGEFVDATHAGPIAKKPMRRCGSILPISHGVGETVVCASWLGRGLHLFSSGIGFDMRGRDGLV